MRNRALEPLNVDDQGNTLTLRDQLTPGTIRKLAELPVGDALTQEDIWRRRQEMLFERLAVRWEIAELPLTEQAMLLGRLRMADSDTRAWVRQTIADHLSRHIPELA